MIKQFDNSIANVRQLPRLAIDYILAHIAIDGVKHTGQKFGIK